MKLGKDNYQNASTVLKSMISDSKIRENVNLGNEILNRGVTKLNDGKHKQTNKSLVC